MKTVSRYAVRQAVTRGWYRYTLKPIPASDLISPELRHEARLGVRYGQLVKAYRIRLTDTNETVEVLRSYDANRLGIATASAPGIIWRTLRYTIDEDIQYWLAETRRPTIA